MKAHGIAQKTSEYSISYNQILIMFLKSIFVFGFIIRYALVSVIVIYALGYCLSFFDNLDSNLFAKPIIFYDLKLSAYPKSFIPLIKGHDFSHIILCVATYCAQIFMGVIAWHAFNFSEYLKVKQTIKKSNVDLSLINESKDYLQIEEKMRELKFSGKKDGTQTREELLKTLKEVQRNLDSMKRNLAFLAVDVVDSTGMKVGENPAVVELDFADYKNLIEKAFKENGYLKASWTPDGVMSCFNTADNAVKAAQKILRDLKDFNRNHKSIKRDFVVRCGINCGKVSYDENLPAESMCDRVIDIAGHFQKYAPPGNICISKNVYNELHDTEIFKISGQKVDGLEAYISR